MHSIEPENFKKAIILEFYFKIMTIQEKEEENRQKQKLIGQLKKIGNLGYKAEREREKNLLNQANGIFTVISIYSLLILYVISFKIINLEGWRLIFFLFSSYIFLLSSLVYSIRAQIQKKH